MRRQQPIGSGQATGKRHEETRHSDFHALAIEFQIDHITEDMPEQQGKTQAVEVFQPVRRNQLRATELPARLDPEVHQQRQAEARQQQLTDNRNQTEVAPDASGHGEQRQGHEPEGDDHHAAGSTTVAVCS
ncbi:hypothetical protein D3C81_1246170 [compost metagenome]